MRLEKNSLLPSLATEASVIKILAAVKPISFSATYSCTKSSSTGVLCITEA